MNNHKLLALGLIFLLFPAPALAVPYWSVVEQVTNSSAWAHNGDEAAGPDGTMHMLTLDNRTGLAALYYQRKPEGSQIWSAHTVLSHETGGVQAGKSAIFLDAGGSVYTVWEEYYGGNISLYFRYSQDAGVAWSAPVLAAGSATSTVKAVHPDLVVDGNGIMHLTWLDDLTGRVRYRKGPADGLTLSTAVTLSGTPAASPGIAIGINRLVAFWQETVGGYEQIKYRESTDFGESWSNSMVLSNASAEHCEEPHLVFDDQDNFYGIWIQAQGQIVVIRRGDALYGLLSDLTVSTTTGGICSRPAIAVQGHKVVAAWIYNQSGNPQVRINISLDQGETWDVDDGFNSGASVNRPRLAGDRGNIHLFFDYDQAVNAAQVRHALRDDTAPPAPQISSLSHPGTQGSGNNRPSFTWVAEDNPGGIGVMGFAVAFDQQPHTDPGTNVTQAANENSVEFGETGNGHHYLHVRSIDLLANQGEAAHYAVNIDRNSFFPGDQVWVAPSPVRDGRLHLRFFLSKPAEVKLEFYDAIGRRLSSRSLGSQVGINQVGMDIHDWVNGAYFYRLTARAPAGGNEAVVTKAFVVLK